MSARKAVDDILLSTEACSSSAPPPHPAQTKQLATNAMNAFAAANDPRRCVKDLWSIVRPEVITLSPDA
jgi:hypothetical protein